MFYLPSFLTCYDLAPWIYTCYPFLQHPTSNAVLTIFPVKVVLVHAVFPRDRKWMHVHVYFVRHERSGKSLINLGIRAVSYVKPTQKLKQTPNWQDVGFDCLSTIYLSGKIFNHKVSKLVHKPATRNKRVLDFARRTSKCPRPPASKIPSLKATFSTFLKETY